MVQNFRSCFGLHTDMDAKTASEIPGHILKALRNSKATSETLTHSSLTRRYN